MGRCDRVCRRRAVVDGGSGGGLVPQWTPYNYVEGNPVSNADPLGLCGIAGAAISVASGAALSIATGGGYTLAAAAMDATSGALCAGALSKLGKVARAVGSSRKLRAALTAGGVVAQHGDEAHQVVAAGARGAFEARKLLVDKFNIDINDAANGVFLRRDFHRKLHTNRYYQEVYSRLSAAEIREEAIEILRQIARELTERAKTM